MFNVPFNEMSAFDKAVIVAFFTTLALIVLGVAVGIAVKKMRADAFRGYLKTAFSAAVGYAIGLIVVLLFLKLDEYVAADYIDLATFIPVVVMIGTTIIFAVAAYIVSIFKRERLSLVGKIAAIVLAVELLVVLIMQTVKYYKNNDSISVSGEVQLYVYTALLVAIILLLAFLIGKKNDEVSKTRSISYAAMCIALSFALSYITFYKLPQGGSITLASLLPIMIYSYMFGIRRGVMLGAIYGLLQFIQAPLFYHPVQFLLDYPIAFAAIGLAGLFRERKIFDAKKPLQFALGALVAVVLRYLSHVVSGIFVFGSADPENYSAVAWSFLYNTFTFADMAISMVAGCVLFASKSFVRLLDAKKQ